MPLPWPAASAKACGMWSGIRTARPVVALRIMAGLCMALALMCMGLAYAWNAERQEAACWRAAAEFQLQPQGDCRG